ncbi:hydroxyacid dehydrogenase [Anaerocolumna sp. MB42-C2]|uniref:hydroxyacid dehydrogenase n=1 Tax=Anaerocolumna sp. MB42-C2 TaxID=3070997 RepID=UPI0027E1C6E3|nr:hydroxyacid dehydrogenase [Anaerocolumna sp. MB42-C2]WMJ85846.1 hydroxyacid dehydrogenase [Anaerocolumna sp. MB42-C2]
MEILVAMPVGDVRNSFFPDEVIRKVESLGNVTWNTSQKQFSKKELKDAIKSADVCITGWGCECLDMSILETAQKLKIVAHTGGTVVPYVSDFLYNRGIKVISGNTIYAESVSEGVVAYILSALRQIPFYANEVQAGRWRNDDAYNESLLDKTVGIVGYGMVAGYLVKMLKPFKVKIKIYASHVTEEVCRKNKFEKAETLEEIFSTCKIISLHNSLTPETHHMIGKDLLQLISEGALLVNTARGAIIDEKALEEELHKKRFKAILDVYEDEPLPPESKLRNLDNVILMPHMAGPTADRKGIVTSELLDDIANFFNGIQLKYEISKEYAAFMTQ